MKASNIFAGSPVSEFFGRLELEMANIVEKESPDYILQVSEVEYVNHIYERFSIEPPTLDFEKVMASPHEEMIPAEFFPPTFFVARGNHYPKQVFTFYIPIGGSVDLIQYKPSTRILDTLPVYIDDGSLCFDIIDFHQDPNQINGRKDNAIRLIGQQLTNLCEDINNFNGRIRANASSLVQKRRAKLSKYDEIAKNVGVPLKKASDIPSTFKIPITRKKIPTRPSAVPSPPEQEGPNLPDEIYEDILKTIYETGKSFERLPSTYAGKDEETLRDHLILILEPRYEASTTGETFNKDGKTDILIRHEKANIFVAECKVWSGRSKYLESIDQLLSYLTWRDSKTAILNFVKQKKISNVLEEVRKATKEHPCFVRELKSKDESWQMYEFGLPGDLDRHIRVAVLSFHFPED